MSLDLELFDKAFVIFQEYGPARGTPVRERWGARLPELEPGLYDEYVERMERIEHLGYELGEKVLYEDASYDEVYQILRERHPELTEERIRRVVGQGCQHALK